MTVGQPPLSRIGQPKPCDDQIYAQLTEVTGVTDRKIIEEAINKCRNNDGRYEISDVVDRLIKENRPEKKMAISYKNKNSDSVDAVAGPSQDPNKNAKEVIDLTNDGNDSEDIQKAIAASLADSGGPYTQETSGILGGQVSREEQDISRVLEQSLIESKAGTKRKRADIWFVDPLNPHERKRNDHWPIGLKNVGNTCWFSAVIQSLFHLGRFRQLVLKYEPNNDVSPNRTELKRNLRFMQELRHLFALMIGSRRKYVDPSKAVDILKEAFSTSVVSNASVSDNQQDVSEFQHKLLDWLEDAFKSVSRPPSPKEGGEKGDQERSSSNPMVDLFYGQFRAEGVHEGKGFSNEETFGQFPLQVNGFRDIHESLEAATAHKEIETISSESSQKSGQELWFTRLPPVLTFELSRFQFNQQIGRPEKIHNKIEFPQVIYMDRYMDCNRDETRERRERAKKLKEQLAGLQSRLDKFTNYGSGIKRFPLQDVLLYALEFAKSNSKTQRKSASIVLDVEMECLSPINCSNMMVDSPIKSPPDVPMATAVMSPQERLSPDVSNRQSPSKSPSTTQSLTIPDVPMTSSSTPASASNTPPDVTMTTECRVSPVTVTDDMCNPQPRHVTENELVVLQDCLHRWRTEVENDVRELQERISGLENAISKMYSDESMIKHAYHLHAVLVHEGQAASGHYWAYIHDAATEQWLKFNDISVSEASWEELEKESVGGYHNASAYCLMYIDKTRIEEMNVTPPKGNSSLHEFENLPEDLKELVAIDNKLFNEEIEKWDREQARKAMGAGDADISVIREHTPASSLGSSSASSSTVSTQTSQPSRTSFNLAAIHAQLSGSDTLAAVKRVLDSEVCDINEEQEAINKAISGEQKRLKSVVNSLPTQFPMSDPRLQHIVVYLMYSECPYDIVQLILLEQIAELIYEHSEKIKKIKGTAQELVKEVKKEHEKLYNFWHETFHIYLKSVSLFIRGVSLYFDEKHIQALPYLLHSHLLSEQLRARQERAGLCDPKLSAFFLRQTLLYINDAVTQQFEDSAEVTDLFDVMLKNVLPCLQTVVQSGLPEDITAVEEIREKWCTFLGQEIEAHKCEQLQDFLAKLFEPPADLRLPREPIARIDNILHLHKHYIQVLDNAERSGYVDRARTGS